MRCAVIKDNLVVNIIVADPAVDRVDGHLLIEAPGHISPGDPYPFLEAKASQARSTAQTVDGLDML